MQKSDAKSIKDVKLMQKSDAKLMLIDAKSVLIDPFVYKTILLYANQRFQSNHRQILSNQQSFLSFQQKKPDAKFIWDAKLMQKSDAKWIYNAKLMQKSDAKSIKMLN